MCSIDRLMELAQFRPLTGREIQSLNEQLCTSDEAMNAFLDRCRLEADLRFLLRGPLTPELRLADRNAGAD
jgi:hypothetical protein